MSVYFLLNTVLMHCILFHMTLFLNTMMNDAVHIPFLNALIDPNDNFAVFELGTFQLEGGLSHS
ncbi:hypothetical protein UP17_17240 [Peribacillus simplex]|nr:hypothetical protein UP17_17240 [Peribacillus simplex]